MRQTAERLMAVAAIPLVGLVGALWAGGAPAQSLASPANAVPAMSSRGTSAARRAESVPVGIQGTAMRLSAAEIVARMLEKNQERLVALERYESERTYRVEYTGTGGEHHAEIQVHAEYMGPNQKRLTVESESGSKFICDKVLRRLVESEREAAAQSNRMQTTLSPKNYDTELLAEETVAVPGGSIRAWVLRVTPKVNNKFTYRGKVWISEDDYAMVKIQGEPAKNPSLWINRTSFESVYLRRGDVWLPAKNVSSSHVRIGGEATLTITYGTYPVIVERALKPTGDSSASRAVVLGQ
jgi:hypothetical protein